MKTTGTRALRLLAATALTAVLFAACRDRPTTVEPATAPTKSIGSPGMAPPDVGQLAILDRDFVTLASSAGALEIDASRLALERSSDNDVRAFALRMVDEHAAASKELQGHVARLGLPAASQMLPMHGEELQRLRALRGELFDREYVAQVGIAAHVEAIAVFERAATTVADDQLRAYAEKTVAVLRKHLQMAEKLAQDIGVPADRLQAARTRPAVAAQTTIGTTGTTGTTPLPPGGSGK
jgi:putative membrane protein